MPQLIRRRTILAKIETTYGIDSTPTGAANAILIRNLNVQPVASTIVQRDNYRPYLGNFEQLLADTHVQVDFEVEMAGAGAAGSVPAYGPLLRACGLSETISAGVSVTYAPVSSAFESVTMYFNNDGTQHKITGARGSVELSINARQIPIYKFSFQGLYNAPTAAALPTVAFGSFQTPLVSNNTNTTGFSFFSASPVLESLSLNINNTVNFRSLIGSQYVQIADRKASGSAMFEAPALATKDYFALAAADGTLGDLSITHGTTAGNKVQITSATIDIANPSYSDNGGIAMLQVPFVAVPTTAGNDEFAIIVK